MEEFGYIVVGAGTAGCVLAARLSEDVDKRVLLLEAGGPERTPAMADAGAWPSLLGSEADWAEMTTPQAKAGPVIYPRGRALGGSGAINAMAHVRGHRAVYDIWAAGGAIGWGFTDMLPYFQRAELADGRDPDLRGTAGPVRVAPAAEGCRHPVAVAFAKGLVLAGYPVTDDLSGARQDGVAWADLAIADGERVSPADAYLRPVLGRANLTVRTGCLATRLVIEGGRCAGVSYLRGGELEVARCAQEVLVCAGAIGSPRLLLLSGIGPAGELRALGIDVVADLPVGENLQDHPVALACYALPSELPASRYNHGEVYAVLGSKGAGGWPDVHLFPILLPVAPPGHQAPAAGFALAAGVVAPDSRGSVRLASADPGAAPLIDPGFLRESADLGRLAEGLALARDLGASEEFGALAVTEAWPGPGVRDLAGLRGYIRRTVGSYYHPAGTCPMGVGPDTVTDPELRVHGVAGLRVADASVMPVICNAHPNATVLAIAEKAADLIRGLTSAAP